MQTILRIVPNIYDPESPLSYNMIGGVQIQVYRLVKALSSEEIMQDVLSFQKVNMKINNVKFLNSKHSSKIFKSLFCLIKGVELLIKNKYKYNMIHIHADGGLFPLLFGEIAYILFNQSIVYTFHCCRNITYKGKGLEILIVPLMNFIERKCIQHSACSVFLSQDVVDKLIQKKIINEGKYSVIGDTVVTDIKNCSTLKKVQSKEIVFIGRITEQKGWRIFLDCARSFKQESYSFKIYGSGPDVKKMKRAIKKYRLENLKYYGNVPNEKIFDVLINADIVMIPSLWEELGSIVLEAGILKKTVVASKVGALSEILADGRGYLAQTGNTDDFYSKLQRAIKDEEKRGEKLYDYVMKNYSVKKAVKKYMNIYCENC